MPFLRHFYVNIMVTIVSFILRGSQGLRTTLLYMDFLSLYTLKSGVYAHFVSANAK